MEKTVTLADGRTVPAHARRSRRARRISLRMDRRSGALEIVLPPGATLEEGIRFAQREAEWIARQIASATAPPDNGGVAAASITLRDGRIVPVRPRRSARARRVALRIGPHDGALELVLPPGMTLEEGMKFARGQAAWIARRLAADGGPVPFTDGATFPLLGETLTIRRDEGRSAIPFLDGNILVVGGREETLSARVHRWLVDRAGREIESRIRTVSSRVGREPRRVTVRDTRSRWGSCSKDGNISLSWRLVLGPRHVLDYVIAHEMAHLRELNHGPRFWALVEKICPEFEGSRQWLRDHGTQLHRYGREAA